MKRKIRHAQVSMEYLIIVGFVTFIVIAILGIAFFYSGTIKDRIKMTQINNFANKIISTAETVFYAGEPSKATISAYLPKDVKEISITSTDLVVTFPSSSGENTIAFSSNVPLSGSLSVSQGLKKIEIVAEADQVSIS